MDTGHIGKLIACERARQGVAAEVVCRGLCDLTTYNKLESGEGTADIHVVRIVLQRLGISAGLAGRYLCRDEYDEMSARFNILEYLKSNQLTMAEAAVCEYGKRYCGNNRLNRQFRDYMSARMAELHGDTAEALSLYESAVGYTTGDYHGTEITCISMYEYFMLANVARLNAVLGKHQEAEKLYEKLLAYCKRKNPDQWIMTCIYPKTVCEMLYINTPQSMGTYDRQVWLEECNAAIRILRDTARLHFMCPLLKIRHTLLELLGEKPDKQWDDFLEHYEWLRNKYGVTGELLEWYPYYNSDWEFYPVEQLIDERRRLYGMTMEELAEGVCTPETVSRIINRRVSPKYSTVEALLDKLGLRGVLSEDVIVSEDNDVHRIWNDMVQCQSIGDYVTGRKLYDRLKEKLDASIPINKKVLEYIRIELDMVGEVDNYKNYALIHEKMLDFNIDNIEKLTVFTRIEAMIINRYFYCKDKIKDYTKLETYEAMCSKYLNIISNGRAFASNCEGILVRCASYTGNAARFGDSNNYSELGIKLELDCERMHCLSSLIYCISWNNVESGKNASDDDIKMCKCAYWIAYALKENERMNLYSRWIMKHRKLL